MPFIEEPRFPEKVSGNDGWRGGPAYQTDTVTVESGREQRNQVWSYPRHEYDASHAARLSAQYVPLRDFFHITAGMANGFRVKDWFDYQVTAAQGQWTLLTATTFQMVRVYTAGISTRTRLISKPVSGMITTTGGTLASIDYTTGIATMSSGTPSTWSGEFDVPCRFLVDQMSGRILHPSLGGVDLIMDWDSIPITEIRI